MENSVSTQTDAEWLERILGRIANDLRMILGRELCFEGLRAERRSERPAGAETIHISFKLGLRSAGGALEHGCLLVPLAEAITWACYLLMIPEEAVAGRREETRLDGALKDALLEIGNLLAASMNSGLAELGSGGWTAFSEGCQGVRAGVRPAFPYVEGSELVVGRVRALFPSFPASELLLILPVLS